MSISKMLTSTPFPVFTGTGVPLNPRSGEFPKPTGNACQVNESGIPLCKAGLPMRRCSHDKKKHRVYYNCPVKRPTHRKSKYQMLNHEEECPLGVLCHPDTKMSPVVYVKTTDDPRLYPPLPRSSDQFKVTVKKGETPHRIWVMPRA